MGGLFTLFTVLFIVCTWATFLFISKNIPWHTSGWQTVQHCFDQIKTGIECYCALMCIFGSWSQLTVRVHCMACKEGSWAMYCGMLGNKARWELGKAARFKHKLNALWHIILNYTHTSKVLTFRSSLIYTWHASSHTVRDQLSAEAYARKTRNQNVPKERKKSDISNKTISNNQICFSRQTTTIISASYSPPEN